MRVPLSWLKDYVDVEESLEEVDRLLTDAGLEVKAVERIGIPGADLVWEREKIVLSHLLRVEHHPDADRLVLATVAFGNDQTKTVVTGAPNLFDYLGHEDLETLQLYSPLALEGATLYDGHKDGREKMKLKGRPLRGIYNDAMLCSEKELGISNEHTGVILMQKNQWSPAYQAGTPLQDVLGDAVYDIDIIPNIARCTSILGVAREYAALTNRLWREPDYTVVMEGAPIDGRVVITTEHPDLNPRFVALIIEGVQQVPSPYWMQHRLRLAGQRPINVVVDISNYVMLEMGQPNHTFDLDYLHRRAQAYDAGGPIHIHTRLPHKGEKLTTLDDVTHSLPPHTILVTDPEGNLSLGGIMGGKESEIRPETENVLLEAAAWNFINIRRSSTDLDIHTDAAFRFSRGVHPSQAILGAKRAAELMRRLAGGTVAQGIFDYYPNPPEPVTIELSPEYARRLSGLNLEGADMEALLKRLAFEVEPYGDHIMVTVPDYRMDVEGPHDLVEEICRLYGYGNIPSTIIADVLPPQRGNPSLEREEQVRDLLVRLGLQEVITYRLTSPAHEAKLIAPNSDDSETKRPYVTLTNPISTERSVLRHSVLASILEVAARNSRFQERMALFEIGKTYHPAPDELLPEEPTHLALVMTGWRTPPSWQADAQPKRMDFFDLKGVLEALFSELHVAVTFEADAAPAYWPGRMARLLVAGQPVGMMGALHPLVVTEFDVRVEQQPVLAAEIDLDLLLEKVAAAQAQFEAISPYPAVHEDLALVVDATLPAIEVETAVFQAGGFLLKQVELFDVYEGAQIPPGKKSLAYHLTFQSPSKTLTDKEVQKLRQQILKQVQRHLGAQLRA